MGLQAKYALLTLYRRPNISNVYRRKRTAIFTLPSNPATIESIPIDQKAR
jgi:hypothetical protein